MEKSLDQIKKPSSTKNPYPSIAIQGPRAATKDANLAQQKHQKIIDGACQKFFKKGYHKTTIREIAEASGMSMGQLYHYISSKDDVLFLIYQHMQRVWHNHLIQSGIDDISGPQERLNKALYYTLEFMIENKDLILFIYTETKYLEKNHLHVVLEMDDKAVVGFWYKLLKEAHIELPDDAHVDFFANLLSYLMVFFPLRGWHLKGQVEPQHLDWLVGFIQRGLGVATKQGAA